MSAVAGPALRPPLSELGELGDDGWAWRSGPCRALEHPFEVRVEPAELAGEIEVLVGALVAGTAASAPVAVHYDVREHREYQLPYTLHAGAERLASGRSASDLAGMLWWHVNRSVIRTSVPRYLLLHAAAARKDGVTVVLPADMESGKTTTVAGLLRAGYEYVTDEAVAVDPATLEVTPYPKTLSLDPGSWSLFPEVAPHDDAKRRQWHVRAEDLGSTHVRGRTARPQVVVFPRYVEGAGTAFEPISPGAAALEVARCSFGFADHPRHNLTVAGSLTSGATTGRLTIGSLAEAVTIIDGLVRSVREEGEDRWT